MRAVVQRARAAHVIVDDEELGRIARGLVVLLGVARDDGEADVVAMADKVADLRVFDDAGGRMNRSVVDVGGEVLVVSQFTLLGDVRRGRRPSYTEAAPPDLARECYDSVVHRLRERGIPTAVGRFQADMQIHLVNDGPVTILIDTRKVF